MAREQLTDFAVDMVQGNVRDVAGFANALEAVDTLFHTAAYFRGSYMSGRH